MLRIIKKFAPIAVIAVMLSLAAFVVSDAAGTDFHRGIIAAYLRTATWTTTGTITAADLTATDDVTAGDDVVASGVVITPALVLDAETTDGAKIARTGNSITVTEGDGSSTLGVIALNFVNSNSNVALTNGVGIQYDSSHYTTWSNGTAYTDTKDVDVNRSAAGVLAVGDGDGSGAEGAVLAGAGGTTAFILSSADTNGISLKSDASGWLAVMEGDGSTHAQLILRMTCSMLSPSDAIVAARLRGLGVGCDSSPRISRSPDIETE